MELSGKGYIQGGEGVFITSTGERYHYHDGELTRTEHDTPTVTALTRGNA